MATDARAAQLDFRHLMMAGLRRLGRRLIGRHGPAPAPRPPSQRPVAVQRVKTERAGEAAREAREAVDSFTRSLDQAMRGQRP